MLRRYLQQRIIWPVLLIITGGTLATWEVPALFGAWAPIPGNLAGLLRMACAVGAVMTGVMRRIGPVAEAYRLGMSAGAREQREICAHEHAAAGTVAVGDDSGGWPAGAGTPTARRAGFRLVSE